MKILMGRVISKNRAGVTSLLLVLAIGLILTIMVAGISALSIREQQQARKTDLSSRALQAAEAGIKIASAELSTNPGYSKPDCTIAGSIFDGVPLGQNASITCATVTSAFTGAYEGYLSQDRAIQVFAGPSYPASGAGPPPSYVDLQWHDTSLDGALTSPTTSTLYPTVTGPDYIAAASIEITVTYWPSTAIGIDTIKSATIFFVPGTPDAGYSNSGGRTQVKNTCGGSDYKCATTAVPTRGGFDLRGALGLTVASGTPTATYNAYNMAIRIKPRYRDTHFKLSFFGSVAGSIIPIQSTSAQIDVTAKVDNLYRRVKAEKLIYPVAVENVLDSVVYTGGGDMDDTNFDICKRMIIRVSDKVLVPDMPAC